ncbi:unnamed protein product [Adineta ricciae]|uniref:Nuclear receptor domain-containing protein n=1 Tax=Adineta ricciae TaxID=249248 RepID=A0A815KVQ4_ADIRI|nr:unnamed protein product [Adineta ricciae]
MASAEKKSSNSRKDLICTVCGAPATGFNFAVITCMCCKAFFRRNALFGLSSLQCRYLSEKCSINIKTRRDCSYCRLKKCFDVGMKKELILTDESKRIKREKILANRQMTLNLIRPVDTFDIKRNSPVKPDHSANIANIYNAFEDYCFQPLVKFDRYEFEFVSQQPVKSRIKLQHYYQYYMTHEASLTDFFKRVPELRKFPEDQQMVLCKHNMRFLIRMSLMETRDPDLPLWPAINLLIETIFGKSLLEESDNLLRNFKEEIRDSKCIRLLLIIFLFSTHSSYNGHLDTLAIYDIQTKYTELLWAYYSEIYDYSVVCERFSTIVRHCLHLQRIGRDAEAKREELQRTRLCLESE